MIAMESDTRTDPDQELERSGDEFEERLEKVESQIDDAHTGAADQRDHTQSIEAKAAAGDDEDDEAAGDSSSSDGFDDPEAEEEDEDEDE